ncbi:hypothetical protein MASR1M60_01770 [Rhodocyclaceae bacterium]
MNVTRMILGFCCAAAAPSWAADAGIVKTVRGQAMLERAAQRLEIKVGDAVQEKDRVIVSANGSVGISMHDETLLSLGPNSTMVIGAFAYNPVTREGQVETSILKGTLRYVTGLIGRANPAAVKVLTPTSTLGIRGTEFIVDVPADD